MAGTGWRGLAAAAAAVVLAAGLARLDWPTMRRLSRDGVAADGWVTAKGLGGARRVHYSFSAGGRLYSGVGRAGRGAPDYDELAVDDRVVVVHLPDDPDVSVLGDPDQHLREQNVWLLLGLLAAGPALGFWLRRELRRSA